MSDTEPRPNSDPARADDTVDGASATESDRAMWLSGIASLVGAWVALSPFVYDVAQAALWNDVLVGGAVFLVAGYNYYRHVRGRATSVGAMSLVAILGLWTALAPFLLATTGPLLWSNAVSGLATALIGGYVGYREREVRATAPTGTP